MNGRRTRWTAAQSGSVRGPDRAAEHLLELLARTGRPLTVDELRREGVSAPAQAIYELQLAGYEIDRVAVGRAGDSQASGYWLRTPVPDAAEPHEPAPSSDPPPHRHPDPALSTAQQRRRGGSARIGGRRRRRAIGAG